MGNNRLQLKEKIMQDLQQKIEGTRKILTDLEAAVGQVQRNSTKAQGDIQIGFEELQRALATRKLKLISEIEELSIAQCVALQESIQLAYLELGSLQSTLFHIDSFDLSQLTNIGLEQFRRSDAQAIPPPVKTELNSSDLKKEILQWGSTFVDVAASKSDSQSGCASTKCPVGTVLACDSIKSTSALDFNVDQWLQEIKAQTSDQEFEMLYMEAESKEADLVEFDKTEEVTASPQCSTEEDIVVVGSDSTSVLDDNDDPSSIVCMDSEDAATEEDLSKWLKPKKSSKEVLSNPDLSKWLKPKKSTCLKQDMSKWLKPRNTNNLSSPCNAAIVPQEVLLQKFTPSTIPSKSQYLEYPCLRLDPQSWLHKKIPKENVNYNLRTDYPLAISQKQIIPPTYALPYPFWLKKC